MVLRNASCKECAKITSLIEQDILRGIFKIIRPKIGIKSRKKHGSTFRHHIKRITPQGLIKESVELRSMPNMAYLFSFPWEPPIMQGVPRGSEFFTTVRLCGFNFGDNTEINHSLTKAGAVMLNTPTPMMSYVRALAKIAHAYAAAERGVHAFKPFLTGFILSGADNMNDPLYYMGESPDTPPNRTLQDDLHEIYLNNQNGFVVVDLRLLACFNMPIYRIVVGTLN